jgi:hypothetical protein
MEIYGIIGKEKTLHTRLTNIYPQVLLNNTKTHNFVTSKWSKIHHYMPQGSVLGPLLLYYIYL